MAIKVRAAVVGIALIVATVVGVTAQAGSIGDAGYASGVTAAELRAALDD